MADDVTLSPTEAIDLARTALMRVGMVETAARALARATVDAETAGKMVCAVRLYNMAVTQSKLPLCS